MKKILLFIFVVISCVCIHDTISRVYYKQTSNSVDPIVYNNLLSSVESVDKKVYAEIYNITDPDIDIYTRIKYKLAILENTVIDSNNKEAKNEYLNDVNRVKLRIYELNKFKSINSFYLYIKQLFITFNATIFVYTFIFTTLIFIVLFVCFIVDEFNIAKKTCKFILSIIMLIVTIIFIFGIINADPSSFVTINSRFIVMLLIDIISYCIYIIFNQFFSYFNKMYNEE